MAIWNEAKLECVQTNSAMRVAHWLQHCVKNRMHASFSNTLFVLVTFPFPSLFSPILGFEGENWDVATVNTSRFACSTCRQFVMLNCFYKKGYSVLLHGHGHPTQGFFAWSGTVFCQPVKFGKTYYLLTNGAGLACLAFELVFLVQFRHCGSALLKRAVRVSPET